MKGEYVMASRSRTDRSSRAAEMNLCLLDLRSPSPVSLPGWRSRGPQLGWSVHEVFVHAFVARDEEGRPAFQVAWTACSGRLTTSNTILLRPRTIGSSRAETAGQCDLATGAPLCNRVKLAQLHLLVTYFPFRGFRRDP